MWETAGAEAQLPWAWPLRWQPGLGPGCGAQPWPCSLGSGPGPSSAILGCRGMAWAMLDPVTPFTGGKLGPEASRLPVHFSLSPHVHSGRKGGSPAFKHEEAGPALET